MNSKSSSARDSSGLNSIEELVHQVIQTLLKSKQTVSFAESCTGGMLSARMAEVSGVSAVYKGSVVSYSNEAKVEIIGVGLSSLQAQGAVSQVVAQEMAQGVRHCFHTDWGVSITGIAGPTGGSAEKPVGTVWIAVGGPPLANRMGGRTRLGSDRTDSKSENRADNHEALNPGASKVVADGAQTVTSKGVQNVAPKGAQAFEATKKFSESFVEARKYFFKGDRKQIQEQSVQAALELVLEAMLETEVS